MNVMSGINRKLNQNEGRQIVDYINKRIEEKADMERRGIPFFKADSEAFESQDIKRLTILDKVFKTRTNPLKSKRVKEFKIARAHKPFWCELAGFMNMTKSGAKKDRPVKKTKENDKRSLPVATLSQLDLISKPSSEPSPEPSPDPSPGSSLDHSHMSESFEDDGDDEDPFSWRQKESLFYH